MGLSQYPKIACTLESSTTICRIIRFLAKVSSDQKCSKTENHLYVSIQYFYFMKQTQHVCILYFII